MHCYNDPHYGLPATFESDLGHVLWEGNPLLQTGVSHENLLLAQPSHGPIHPYENPHDVASTHYDFEGYPAVASTPQVATLCYPVWSSQSMVHTLGQCLAGKEVTVGQSTIPVRLVSRGLSTCKWVLEDGTLCCQTISGETVPKHLAEHGIKRIRGNRVVRCNWQGCGKRVKRRGVTRHCREAHLGLKRKPCKACFPETKLVNDKH